MTFKLISAAGMALSTTLALSACGSSDSGTATSSPSPSVGAVASVDSVVGKLDSAAQAAVTEDISEIVDDTLKAAYLGSFPRESFDAALTSFTAGAAQQAARDLDLLTSAELSPTIVKATQRAATTRLDIFASKGEATGVTARWELTFDVEPSSGSTGTPATQTVAGSFAFTPEADGWKIFSYSVDQGPAVSSTAGSAVPTTEVTP